MPETEPIRVTRGDPTAEELAALVAVLLRHLDRPAASARPAARSRWAASALPRPSWR